MEALKTKVLSLTLELKEAKNEIDQLQQEIFDLKENVSKIICTEKSFMKFSLL